MRAGMQGIRLSCTVADLHSIRWIIYYKSYWQTPLHEPENGSGRIEFIHKRRTALHKHTDNQQPSAKQHTPLIVMINLLLALGYMAGIYWLSSIPGEYTPVRHCPVDPAGHSEPGTHSVIRYPCLAVVPVARRLDEKHPRAIQFGIPARNRLWHTG